MPLSVLAIAIASFVVGVSEFIIVGLLPNIASDLGVSIPMAGYLVSWYALGVAIGGPILIIFALKMPKKTALLALMAIFTIGNIISAISTNYEILIISRIITSLAIGPFFGIGFVLATEIVPENKQASSVSFIVTGFTLANVVGVPIGTFIGHSLGWRASFWFVVLLAVISYIAITFFVPKVQAKTTNLKKEIASLKNIGVWLALLITIVGYGGFFIVMTYITPIMIEVSSIPMGYVSIILFIAGIALTIGSIIGGKLADRSLNKTLIITLILFGLITFVFSYTMQFMILSIITMIVWGIMIFASVPAMQLKVMKAAKDAPNIASSLNISAFNVGIGGGALLGGNLLSAGLSLQALPIFGGVIVIIAVLIALISLKIK